MTGEESAGGTEGAGEETGTRVRGMRKRKEGESEGEKEAMAGD